MYFWPLGGSGELCLHLIPPMVPQKQGREGEQGPALFGRPDLSEGSRYGSPACINSRCGGGRGQAHCLELPRTPPDSSSEHAFREAVRALPTVSRTDATQLLPFSQVSFAYVQFCPLFQYVSETLLHPTLRYILDGGIFSWVCVKDLHGPLCIKTWCNTDCLGSQAQWEIQDLFKTQMGEAAETVEDEP